MRLAFLGTFLRPSFERRYYMSTAKAAFNLDRRVCFMKIYDLSRCEVLEPDKYQPQLILYHNYLRHLFGLQSHFSNIHLSEQRPVIYYSIFYLTTVHRACINKYSVAITKYFTGIGPVCR